MGDSKKMVFSSRLCVLILVLFGTQAISAFRCVPVARVSEYCSGMMPKSVCGIGDSVDAVGFTFAQHKADVNITCPKNPALFTKKMFCQGPWLPCTGDSDCQKKTHKRCYDLCMNGGKVAGRTFLGATQCAKGMYPQQYCNARATDLWHRALGPGSLQSQVPFIRHGHGRFRQGRAQGLHAVSCRQDKSDLGHLQPI